METSAKLPPQGRTKMKANHFPQKENVNIQTYILLTKKGNCRI
jgi:hypothetical protein